MPFFTFNPLSFSFIKPVLSPLLFRSCLLQIYCKMPLLYFGTHAALGHIVWRHSGIRRTCSPSLRNRTQYLLQNIMLMLHQIFLHLMYNYPY